jgi:hypothetical protein
MQRHKALLTSLEDCRAPAELHDRVMAAVERDVLLGIAQGDENSRSIVEPRLRLAGERDALHTGRSVQRNLPRLALAAGLMLMVAGLAYFGSIAYRAAKTPLAPDVANNTAPASVGPFANNDGARENTEPTPTKELPSETAGAARSTPDAVTLADAGASPTEVPIERAIELASEGRLAIRVLATKPENLSRIERDVAKPKGDRRWRMTRDVPAGVVAAIVPARETRGEPMMASERSALSLIGPYLGPGAALSMVTAAADPLARVKGTFLIDVPITREQLGVVATIFRNQLAARVVFEELPVAVDAPTSPQSQDVLWWTQGPAQWVPRASVPLVVEQR